MNSLVEEILADFEKGNIVDAQDNCFVYFNECKLKFMEALTVNTATDFAASAILYAKLCAEEKKPWKAVPILDEIGGCIRFMEDFMQNREILSSTCLSVATFYEYAGFLPQALKMNQKVVSITSDPSLMEKAVGSVFYLSLRFKGKIDPSDLKSAEDKLGKERTDSLLREAKEENASSLVLDPVEWEDKFLEIRYELEKKVDEALQKDESDLPYCVRYWAVKKRILSEEYGISWMTPAECNPNVKFQ